MESIQVNTFSLLQQAIL